MPAKSKTKCVYFCGRVGRVQYPDPVQLYGEDLPWVESADHLGHTLHQLTNMEKDSQRARAKFIDKTVEIREELYFARPEQVMQTVQILSSDAYGSMLWNLSSAGAESFFKCWNTCVKLLYGVPRSTFTYLVEGYFASSQVSLRNQILSRYPGFFRSLLGSPSKEVRILARLVSSDPRSSTCLNLRYLSQLSGLMQPEQFSSEKVRVSLPVTKVPESENWRIGLITSLFKLKHEKLHEAKDFGHICRMIDSLCST